MNKPTNPSSFHKIIHNNMDAFYASAEQRYNPDLKGKPVVLGGLPEGRGGVVATCSYEVRKFGVRSDMPSKRASQLCPHIIFIRPRFAVYKEVSGQVRDVSLRLSYCLATIVAMMQSI